jgi:hypothetical protein
MQFERLKIAAKYYCRNQSKEKHIVACPVVILVTIGEIYKHPPHRLTANASKKQKASSLNEDMPPLTSMDLIVPLRVSIFLII